MPDDVLEMIGTAALLEQLAEESAELAQAALKMARKIRNENPTPKSHAEIPHRLRCQSARGNRGCGIVYQRFARCTARPRRDRQDDSRKASAVERTATR